MALRVFEFIINPEDNEMGMKAISLVDKPAIESEYVAFNKAEKKQMYFGVDDKKYIIAGLALIPNKLIYRVDEATEEEFLGYFSAETIEVIMSKFMHESIEGTTHDVNFQHNSEDKIPAHLVESFILRTPEMVDAVKAMGITEATLGSWYVAYKFDNIEAYNKAIEGGFTGYSIEAILQRELKLNKNNSNDNKNFMTKAKLFIDKFKAILTEFEDNEVKLEEGKIADSDIMLRWGDVGTPVLKVAIAEDGSETTEPMPEGEYVLESGDVLVVDAMGNLTELKPKADAPAPIPEEELVETPEVEVPLEVVPEVETPEVPLEELPVETPLADISAKTLGEIVDVSTDGEYSITVIVADGAITEATVEAMQNLIAKADFDAKLTEIETLNAEIVSLKAELEKPVARPLFTEFTTIADKHVTAEDKKKLNNLDYQLKKLGLVKENK
jgi:hypothetical protein